jgi:Domain of unknown function (DUF3797)
MKLREALKLIEKYLECPKCKNQYINNGEGELIVEDDLFYRSCKCGWNVTIKEKK